MPNHKFIDKLLEKYERVDRKQLEEHFKSIASENIFFRNAIDQLEHGIVVFDKNSFVFLVNSTAEFLLGISAAKLKHKKITSSTIDISLLGFFEKAFSLSYDTFQEELHVVFPREQLLRIIVSVVKDASGDILGWIASVLDISEFRRASAQKAQTEKLKALITMASILAHELGNPLNSLSIHLQLAGRTAKTLPQKCKGKMSKLLSVAQAEVKRLDDIVTRFLQATRPLKTKFFEGDIHRVLDETIELLAPELKKNKISVHKEYGSDIPRIYMDQIQIRQAFINVIKNAVEAIHKKGLINIATLLEGNRVKISFTDNGIGIPEYEISKIFEPYFSTKREGSGLGLVIVHRIMRDHGGQIEVHSKLGYGTTVILHLPVEFSGQKLLPESKK
jgi:PAS domain S-box-containing protein